MTVFRRPWAPLVALLVAMAVGALGASGAPRYAASTTMVVTIVDSSSGLPDPVAALTSARAALATAPVAADVAERAGVPAEHVASAVSLDVVGAGALAVTAVGDSHESAVRLAAGARDAVAAAENTSTAEAVTATIEALNTRLIDVQLRVQEWSRGQGVPSGLLAERDVLVKTITQLQATPPLLEPGPDPVAAPVPPGPAPWPDAAVAFLVALAVLAVVVLVHRAAGERRPEASPGVRLEQDLDPSPSALHDDGPAGETGLSWPYEGLTRAR